MLSVGLVLGLDPVVASGVVVLGAVGSSTGIAVCWHSAAELTLGAVGTTLNVDEPISLARVCGRRGKVLAVAPAWFWGGAS